MKIIKRVVMGLVMAVAVVLLAVTAAWQLVSDATLMTAIDDRLELALGAKVSYQAPAKIVRTLSPELSVMDLIVADDQQRYTFQTSLLRVEISLPKLLFGQLEISRLWLGDTRVEIADSTSTDAPNSQTEKFSLPLTPLLNDVKISQLTVVHEGEQTRLPEIGVEKLAIKLDPDSDSLDLFSRIEVQKYPLDINATLKDISKAQTTLQLPFSISVVGEAMGLSTDGEIDFNQSSPSVDAIAQGRVSQLQRFSSGVGNLDVPGEVTANAHVIGAFDQLAIEKLTANWQAPNQSSAQLSGRIANINDLDGFELALSAQLTKPDWLSPLLSSSMGSLETAALSAQLSGSYEQLAVREFSMKSKDTEQLQIGLSGQLDIALGAETPELQNMGLALSFSAPNTRAARALIFEDVPEFGAVTASAEVRSTDGAPALENLVVKTKDHKGIDVDLKGRIAQFPLDADKPNTGYALAVVMKANKTSLMAERLDVELPLTGPLDFKFRIEGDTQALQLNKIALSAGTNEALMISATGKLGFGPWDQADPLQRIDLKLGADSADTKSLGEVIGVELPELGALTAWSRLRTVSGKHRLDDFRIYNAKSAPLKLTVEGGAKSVVFQPELSIDGMQFTVAANTGDAAQLNAVFGWQLLVPAIGPLNANAKISGSDQALIVNDVSMTAGQKDTLLIEANGKLGMLSGVNNWQPTNADIGVNVSAASSSHVASTLGYSLPELGPLTGRAQIHDKDKMFGMDGISVVVGDSAAPALQLTGVVGDLVAARNIQADLIVDVDTAYLAAFMDNPKLHDLKPLQGKLVISDSDGTLGIDVLHLESTHPQLLSLRVDGQFSDFSHPETLTLDSQLTAADTQLVGALFNLDWHPLGAFRSVNTISKSDKGLHVEGSVSAGEFSVDANVTADLTSSRPYIQGEISAHQFFFPELTQKTPPDQKQKPATEKSAKHGPVFSSTPIDFSILKKADLDLSVDIKSFDKQRSQIDSATFKITLKSGDLSVDPANFVYPSGLLDIDVRLDTRDKPKLLFKAFGENLNPWLTLDMESSKDKAGLEAEMDVDLDLTATGISEHELVSNLDGDIYLTITNGRMRKFLLQLVFVDVVGWTFSKATASKYMSVSCGVADYKISKGVVSTNAFFIDTKPIMITGDGSIDLGKEQLDYVFLPRKKSRVFASAEPVTVKGSLSAPKVRALPWKSAATTYGSLVFAPYIFVGATAFDYVTGLFKGKEPKSSPCLDYQNTHGRKKTAPGP